MTLGADFLIFVVAAVPAAFLGLYIVARLYPWPRKNMVEFAIRQRQKYNPNGQGEPFHNLLLGNGKALRDLELTESTCYLSVVIPAMNEEKRLPKMLDECLEYLNARARDDTDFSYEVIVVDDGSSDKTSDIAYKYSTTGHISVLKLKDNVGKGGAVRNGVLCSRGKYILFADADGATKFSDFKKLEAKMLTADSENSSIVVVGSRAHLEKDSITQRSVLRTILMVGFHLLVYIFAVRTVRDTQCGFKLFSRKSAAFLFPRIHVERWAFDVELLYLAEMKNIPVQEVSVEWHEVEGSKLAPLWTSIEMGRDIILIWLRYWLGVWKIAA